MTVKSGSQEIRERERKLWRRNSAAPAPGLSAGLLLKGTAQRVAAETVSDRASLHRVLALH